MSFEIKEAFARAGRKTKELIYTTPIEVAIGALLVGSLLSVGSYQVQKGNEGKIEIAFSEVGKTMQEYERAGKPVPPLTRFQGKNSDFTMQFFEASNTSFETDGSNRTFARELEFRMDPSFRVHRQIPAYAAELPGAATDALGSLDKLVKAQQELPPVVAAFNAAWSERHDDVTHTVYDTTCDSDGKNCTTTSHEVYDYTIHKYWFDRAQGEQASQALGAFLQRHPNLNIEERLVLATKTDPENEYAIEKSFKEALGGKIPTPLQALQIANTWATGSNFTHFMPVVTGNHSGLTGSNAAWNQAKHSADEYYRYTTYSHSDSGPAEYQVSKRAEEQADAINTAAHKITDGIRFAGQQAPRLAKMAQEFIDVTLDKKPGNADKIRRDMMSLARQMYQSNYENGLDVQPFKWAVVLLFAGIGLLTGGLAGKGVDNVLNKHRRRGFPVGDLLEFGTWKKLAGIKGGLKSVFTAEAPPRETQETALPKNDNLELKTRKTRDFSL